MHAPDERRLEQWARAVFQRTDAAPEHFEFFAKLFRRVYDEVMRDQPFDPMDHPTALLDPTDDADGTTAHAFMEEHAPERLALYLKRLDEGHSHEVAAFCALEAHHENDDRMLAKALQALSPGNWEPNLETFAYAEFYRVGHHRGESELYAHQCGYALLNHDHGLGRALWYAREYEDAFYECLARGRSLLYACAYAERMADRHTVNFSANYARNYEAQRKLGRSFRDARRYAEMSQDYFNLYGCSVEEDGEEDGSNERIVVHTEGEWRSSGKGHPTESYVSKFVNVYYSLPEPFPPFADALDEAERRTDRYMQDWQDRSNYDRRRPPA